MAIWLGKVLLAQKEENNAKELLDNFVQLIKSGKDEEIKTHLVQVV